VTSVTQKTRSTGPQPFRRSDRLLDGPARAAEHHPARLGVTSVV